MSKVMEFIGKITVAIHVIESIADKINRGVAVNRITLTEEIELLTVKNAIRFYQHVEKQKGFINEVGLLHVTLLLFRGMFLWLQ